MKTMPILIPPVLIDWEFYDDDVLWKHPFVIPFDDPINCPQCGEKMGGYLQSDEDSWGREMDRPRVNPYWVIDPDGQHLLCEDCYEEEE